MLKYYIICSSRDQKLFNFPFLYYQDTQNKAVYTYIPEGQPDIDKLIRGQAPFKRLSQLSQTNCNKQKSLIIADWSAVSWDTSMKAAVKKLVEQLIGDGFPVYIWQDGRVIPLTPEMFVEGKESIYSLMTPDSHEYIRQVAAEDHRLTSDQILVLDDYWLENLLVNMETLSIRGLSINKLWDAQNKNRNYLQVLSALRNVSPPLAEIIHDEFGPETNNLLLKIKELFPKLPVYVTYTIVTLKDKQTNTLLEKGEVTVNESVLTLTQLQHAHEIYATSNTLKKIAPYIHSVKSLGLSFYNDPITKPLNFVNLEMLDLEEIDIDFQGLYCLLDGANQLRQLTINACENVNKLMDTTLDFRLPCLEEIYAKSSNISCQILEQLITNQASIKVIHINACEESISDNFSKNLKLVNLRELDASESHLEFGSLCQLLDEAINLTVLDLSDCGHLSSPGDVNNPLKLPNLVTLNLTNSSITTPDLQCLLEGTVNLQHLILRNCVELTDDIPSMSIQLEKLIVLDVSLSTLSGDHFKMMLMQASQLKTLEMDEYNNLSIEMLGSIYLPHLNKISLDRSSVNLQTLQVLLSKMPRLESLGLSGCQQLTEPVTEAFQLTHLKELNLSNTPINVDTLQLLTDGCYVLKTLNLSGCQHLSFNGQPLNLKKLVSLDVSKSSLTVKDLDWLIGQSPSLESLTLSYSLLIMSLLAENSPFDKLRSIDSDAELSNDSFRLLLSRAPRLQKIAIRDSNWLPSVVSNHVNLNSVVRLELISCKIPTRSLYGLLSEAPNLEYLSLNQCSQLTSTPLAALNLPKLKSLDTGMSDIDAETLKHILKAAPLLKSIDISGCLSLVIDDELSELMKFLEVKGQLESDDTVASHAPKKPDAVNEPQAFITRTLNNEAKLDANTRDDPGKVFHTKQYFYPLTPEKDPVPIVNSYRLQSYNLLMINESPCSLSDAFLMSNQGDPLLCSCEIEPSENVLELGKILAREDQDSSYYLSPQQLRITNQWTAVASLSPYEQITHCQLQSDYPLEVSYSQRDRLYYLRHSGEEALNIDVQFLVKVRKPDSEPELPQEMMRIFEDYTHVSSEALDLDDIPNPNGFDYLSCIISQNKGACRHRAAACKYRLEEQFPGIYVAIIWNDCHAFIEFEWQGQRVTRDLGGYEAELTIDTSNRPQYFEKDSEERHQIINEDPRNKQLNYYRKALKTWKRNTQADESVSKACQRLTQPHLVKKRLVEFDSSDDLIAFELSLQAYCQSVSRPCFYVNSPDDLICSAAYMELNGDRGILKKGPGGPLYRFLQAHQDPQNPPVLIVNYDNFDARDMIRFLGLLAGKADGVALPPETSIIGLMNTKKFDCYQETDFYSQFDDIERCQLPRELLAENQQLKAPLPLVENNFAKTYPINLFHAQDWKERLLGRWVIQKDKLTYTEGELTDALASGLPIELQNAPWQDENFRYFWQHAYLHGRIESTAGSIIIPPDFILTGQEGYDWNHLGQRIEWEAGLNPQVRTLNPGSFSEFFNRYEYDDAEHTLDTLDGLVKAQAGKELVINLTRDLGLDDWAMLLSECEKHQVTLRVHFSSNITIPEVLLLPHTRQNKQEDLFPVKHSQQYIGKDPDTIVDYLRAANPGCQVIDISECESNDLLIHTNAQLDEETGQFRFQQFKRVLLNALDKKQTVILKGHFNNQLIDSLTAFVLAREAESQPSGHLIMVSDEDILPCMQAQKPVLGTENKKECLLRNGYQTEEIASLSNETLENECLSRLKTRLTYRRIYPDRSDDSAWRGLKELSGTLPTTFDAVNSAEKAWAFNQIRFDEVRLILQHSPCLCAVGLTGTGKSTFFEKYFNSDEFSFYKVESQKKEWATDPSDKIKILFIDEANLTPNQWSEFEGLFNDPPTILIDGQLFTLTDKHKVVFACNPLSYGNSREIATFFERHGMTMIFEPLSQEFIFEVILKPVFENTNLAGQTAEICLPILQIYSFLCECSENEVLISTRELQMMAMMVLSSCQQDSNDEEAIMAARHYAWQLARTLVPEKHKAEMEKRFRPPIELHRQPMETQIVNDFVITASRQELARQLNDFLNLREFKKNQSINDAQRYGGLGGFIVEDTAGVASIELLALLAAHKYQEIDPSHQNPFVEKGFYRIEPSMGIEDQISLIMKAFNNGDGILMDNISGSARLERLLNDLLMGKTPDGKRPEKPGFFVLASQTPITMAGRRSTSVALKRRVLTVNPPNYEHDEIVTILIAKGMDPDNAELLVKAFELNVEKAKKQQLSPVPTMTDLFRLTNQYVTGQNKGLKRKREFLENLSEKEKGKEKESQYSPIPVDQGMKRKREDRENLPEKEKEKEKEMEKEKELEFPTQPDHLQNRNYYIHCLSMEINRVLYQDVQPIAAHGFFSNRGEMIKSAVWKICNFIEQGIKPDDFSADELLVLNSPSTLNRLVMEMGEQGYLNGSGLEYRNDKIQFVQAHQQENRP